MPPGTSRRYSSTEAIDESNPFFQSLGTNGRTCATCHQVDQAFSLDVHKIQQLFTQTNGQDPLFAPVDGANCPTDPQGQQSSHTLLLQHGLFRIGLDHAGKIRSFPSPSFTTPTAARSLPTRRRESRLCRCTAGRSLRRISGFSAP